MCHIMLCSVSFLSRLLLSVSAGIGTTYINLLAIVFQILYGPGALLGVLGMQKYGLRGTLLVGERRAEQSRSHV